MYVNGKMRPVESIPGIVSSLPEGGKRMMERLIQL
jgi:hypothetical protein